MRSLLVALVLATVGCGPRAQIPAPVDVADPPETAIVTDSGLVYVALKKGGGTTPRANDKVSVHYTGWTVDGAMFDSSLSKGRPTTFVVNEVIAGWTEALLLMKTGSKYRLWIPEELAYRGEAGFPAGTLVFDVSLISIE
jgi:peptidylprolyl isomerase